MTTALEPDDVLEAVAKAYGLTVDDLTGHCRTSGLVEARRVAAHVLHDDCRLSWSGVCAALERRYGGWIVRQALEAPIAGVVAVRRVLYGELRELGDTAAGDPEQGRDAAV